MTKNAKTLSVIIPAYNEADTIKDTAHTIHEILSKNNINHELLFINDGSTDDSWNIISILSNNNKYIKGICFSRNFGKESAIAAGINEASGDCVAVIDCDLQHPPIKIVEMYKLWESGYEIIEGVKSNRGHESLPYKICAKTFYKIISGATGTDMSRSSDFKLLDRKAVLALQNIHERGAFFRALSSWVGFKTTTVEYEVQERIAGKTKWGTKKLVKYALTNIMSFTTLPMQIVTFLGFMLLIITTIFTIISVCQKIAGTAIEGFTTVIILIGFTGSIIMISLGIIGFYISRIFEEVKARPRYIISERTHEETKRNN